MTTRCGPYAVAVLRDDTVRVRCPDPGCEDVVVDPDGARRLADQFDGPLGRFQTNCGAAERRRLSGLLRAAADRVEAENYRVVGCGGS